MALFSVGVNSTHGAGSGSATFPSPDRWKGRRQACPAAAGWNGPVSGLDGGLEERPTGAFGLIEEMPAPESDDSGRAVSETAAAHGVSWWPVQRALNMAATKVIGVDKLRPKMLGIESTGSGPYGSVLQGPGHRCLETLRTLDEHHRRSGHLTVPRVVDGRDHKGVGEWLFARSLNWRHGVRSTPSIRRRRSTRHHEPQKAGKAASTTIISQPLARHHGGPAISTLG